MSRLAQGRSGPGPHSQPAVGLSVSGLDLGLAWESELESTLGSGLQSAKE
jgi:hypothetical protein